MYPVTFGIFVTSSAWFLVIWASALSAMLLVFTYSVSCIRCMCSVSMDSGEVVNDLIKGKDGENDGFQCFSYTDSCKYEYSQYDCGFKYETSSRES
jgi:hypothetical protein